MSGVDYESLHQQNIRQEVTTEGDYGLCLDNSFSRFNAKVVYLEVILEDDDDDDSQDKDSPFSIPGLKEELEEYQVTIAEIQATMNRVKTHLARVRHMQDQLRAFEARDRNVVEANFSRVNSLSLIHVCGLIFSALLQVVMLKSLFEEKSTIKRLWKRFVSH
ncbi:unnamed protein product [Darwinula stevensoni]|uniref:GOLD domain-containing protein n=1 Tax=Darwinula stevensoni TaxID=69355 RepID=A0A7R8X4A3_9CRUS|nr:unnamed protein product [Darwinula stevensoni]CAG0885368.1 unnamed protein product [Darwinula stevensoni]